MALPVYELSFALEGLTDEHRDPLPAITHVTFKRDYLTAPEMCEVMKVCGGDLNLLQTDKSVQFDMVRELLPMMTNLTEEHIQVLHARDFLKLVGVFSPFLEF